MKVIPHSLNKMPVDTDATLNTAKNITHAAAGRFNELINEKKVDENTTVQTHFDNQNSRSATTEQKAIFNNAFLSSANSFNDTTVDNTKNTGLNAALNTELNTELNTVMADPKSTSQAPENQSSAHTYGELDSNAKTHDKNHAVLATKSPSDQPVITTKQSDQIVRKETFEVEPQHFYKTHNPEVVKPEVSLNSKESASSTKPAYHAVTSEEISTLSQAITVSVKSEPARLEKVPTFTQSEKLTQSEKVSAHPVSNQPTSFSSTLFNETAIVKSETLPNTKEPTSKAAELITETVTQSAKAESALLEKVPTFTQSEKLTQSEKVSAHPVSNQPTAHSSELFTETVKIKPETLPNTKEPTSKAAELITETVTQSVKGESAYFEKTPTFTQSEKLTQSEKVSAHPVSNQPTAHSSELFTETVIVKPETLPNTKEPTSKAAELITETVTQSVKVDTPYTNKTPALGQFENVKDNLVIKKNASEPFQVIAHKVKTDVVTIAAAPSLGVHNKLEGEWLHAEKYAIQMTDPSLSSLQSNKHHIIDSHTIKEIGYSETNLFLGEQPIEQTKTRISDHPIVSPYDVVKGRVFSTPNKSQEQGVELKGVELKGFELKYNPSQTINTSVEIIDSHSVNTGEKIQAVQLDNTLLLNNHQPASLEYLTINHDFYEEITALPNSSNNISGFPNPFTHSFSLELDNNVLDQTSGLFNGIEVPEYHTGTRHSFELGNSVNNNQIQQSSEQLINLFYLAGEFKNASASQDKIITTSLNPAYLSQSSSQPSNQLGSQPQVNSNLTLSNLYVFGESTQANLKDIDSSFGSSLSSSFSSASISNQKATTIHFELAVKSDALSELTPIKPDITDTKIMKSSSQFDQLEQALIDVSGAASIKVEGQQLPSTEQLFRSQLKHIEQFNLVENFKTHLSNIDEAVLKQKTSLSMSLESPYLQGGKLQIDIEQGRLAVHFDVTNSHVTQQLSHLLPELKQLLSERYPQYNTQLTFADPNDEEKGNQQQKDDQEGEPS